VIEPDEDHVDFEAYLVIGRVGGKRAEAGNAPGRS
jgi:hypothetical protein